MELKCKINGKEYPIVEGVNFAEEYNETLDSGSIIISGVPQIVDLKPYDDVFIYSGTFNGYPINNAKTPFYRHLLIDQFSEVLVNIDQRIYEYKIELMSETKKLEVIQLPNTSITQPIVIDKKRSVWSYLQQYVEMYSPLYKKAVDGSKWAYNQKYTLDTNLQPIFDNVYCPDFTLNAPSLKDVLTQLMLVKDMLPYVKDDVIYGLDITKRKGQFDFANNHISNVVGSMSSSNYANNLKRGYSNALSQEKSARMVEYLGFRNSESALMTLDNMRLETSFPIYKINKIYLCYYKKGKVFNDLGDTGKEKCFLCKQDITKLVLLNSTRNLLSLDWNDFKPNKPQSIDELAKYKLCTIGYDIGSKYITGWGTKYTYPVGWWTKERTYLQNIIEILDLIRPYGIYNVGYITKLGGLNKDEYLQLSTDFKENFINPFGNNFALGMKAFTFIVDYNSFYNGSVVHSKDNDMRDDITINDNSSSSLALLEKDGLFQKEKLNRFGNKAIQINATYDTIDQMQELGSVYDDDIIIYHREYSIYDKGVNVVYYGTKDYVLKNYFVSVYAKHRTYNLMSYGESVNRAENRKMYLMLSKDKSYYEKENKQYEFTKFNDTPLKLMLSAFIEDEHAISENYFETPNKINAGYITYNGKKYFTDVNGFVNGYSLCFNLKMFDNVSTGVYISDKEPIVDLSVKDDFTGSVQSWYKVVDDDETGFTSQMGFYLSHFDTKNYFNDKVTNDPSYLQNYAYNTMFRMPTFYGEDEPTDAKSNIIGKNFIINKDNKETIDMTYQLEPITNDNNVLFSQWLMKLSNLLATYNKVDETYIVADTGKYNVKMLVKYVSIEDNTTSVKTPLILVEMNLNDYNALNNQKNIASSDVLVSFDKRDGQVIQDGLIDFYSVLLKEIVEIKGSTMLVKADQTIKVSNSYGDLTTYKDNDINITFNKITTFGNNVVPDDKVWFSNTQYISGAKPSARLYPENRLKYNKNGVQFEIPFGKYNFTTIPSMAISNIIDNFAKRKDYFASSGTTKQYFKNMKIFTSMHPLRKTLVYDELSNENVASAGLNYNPNVKVSQTIFYRLNENQIPSLRIPLLFNVGWLNNGHKTITITDTSQLTNVGVFTNWINTNAVKQDTSSGLLGTWVFNDDITGEEVNFNLSFTSNGEELNSLMVAQWFGRVYIFYNSTEVAELFKSSSHTQSIQYWYYDESSQSNKFVFGVNVSDKDKQLGYIDIYLSLLSTRDERVYDDKHNVIGYVNNYASKDNVKIYGEEQYYK